MAFEPVGGGAARCRGAGGGGRARGGRAFNANLDRTHARGFDKGVRTKGGRPEPSVVIRCGTLITSGAAPGGASAAISSLARPRFKKRMGRPAPGCGRVRAAVARADGPLDAPTNAPLRAMENTGLRAPI